MSVCIYYSLRASPGRASSHRQLAGEPHPSSLGVAAHNGCRRAIDATDARPSGGSRGGGAAPSAPQPLPSSVVQSLLRPLLSPPPLSSSSSLARESGEPGLQPDGASVSQRQCFPFCSRLFSGGRAATRSAPACSRWMACSRASGSGSEPSSAAPIVARSPSTAASSSSPIQAGLSGSGRPPTMSPPTRSGRTPPPSPSPSPPLPPSLSPMRRRSTHTRSSGGAGTLASTIMRPSAPREGSRLTAAARSAPLSRTSTKPAATAQ
mmetsp:Transcript_30409/g.78118  ORF Transcript_30409/g.78118 Transcript_30409/m.78118 type:complete len:264 (-) Transcript_30409:38-829(-)